MQPIRFQNLTAADMEPRGRNAEAEADADADRTVVRFLRGFYPQMSQPGYRASSTNYWFQESMAFADQFDGSGQLPRQSQTRTHTQTQRQTQQSNASKAPPAPLPQSQFQSQAPNPTPPRQIGQPDFSTQSTAYPPNLPPFSGPSPFPFTERGAHYTAHSRPNPHPHLNPLSPPFQSGSLSHEGVRRPSTPHHHLPPTPLATNPYSRPSPRRSQRTPPVQSPGTHRGRGLAYRPGHEHRMLEENMRRAGERHSRLIMESFGGYTDPWMYPRPQPSNIYPSSTHHTQRTMDPRLQPPAPPGYVHGYDTRSPEVLALERHAREHIDRTQPHMGFAARELARQQNSAAEAEPRVRIRVLQLEDEDWDGETVVEEEVLVAGWGWE